jgi:hypothetical protein
MTINDANGAAIRAQTMALHAGHQTILRDVLAAGDFWKGAGSSARQGFITTDAAAGSSAGTDRIVHQPTTKGGAAQQRNGG